jgi:PadR family transcriptional regulator, regulatory protein PadR
MRWFQSWRIKRQTDAESRVLSVLESEGWTYGLDLSRLTRMRSGRLYPTLDRLEESGLVEAKWDDEEVRPGLRRRLYRRIPVGTG